MPEREGVAPCWAVLTLQMHGSLAHLSSCPPCLSTHRLLQALLRVALQVHGETIAEHAELRERAQRAQQRLSATWRRLDGLLQSTRCMVGFLGNLQA